MPSTLDNTTSSSTAGFPETINVASDGELAAFDTAEAGSYSLKSSLDELSKRTQYLMESLRNLHTNRPYLRCVGGSTLLLGPLGGVFLYDTAVASGTDVRWKRRNSELSIALAGLSANDWHYLYAYVTGGSLGFEYSTTVPDPATGYQTKTGGSDRWYVGCFYANSTTTATPFSMQRGRYRWLRGSGGLAEGDFGALAGGVASSWAAISLTKWVPPHASSFEFDARWTTTADTNAQLDFRADGESAAAWSRTASSNASSAQLKDRIDLPLYPGGGIEIEYQIGSGGTLAVFAAGFQEP